MTFKEDRAFLNNSKIGIEQLGLIKNVNYKTF